MNRLRGRENNAKKIASLADYFFVIFPTAEPVHILPQKWPQVSFSVITQLQRIASLANQSKQKLEHLVYKSPLVVSTEVPSDSTHWSHEKVIRTTFAAAAISGKFLQIMSVTYSMQSPSCVYERTTPLTKLETRLSLLRRPVGRFATSFKLALLALPTKHRTK